MPSLIKTAPTPPAPSFVLSFQGVDFRLDPQQFGATIAFDHADNGKVLLKLNNFSGSLEVTPSSSATPNDATITAHASTTGRVSLSPEQRPKPTKKARVAKKKPVNKTPSKVVPAKPKEVFDLFETASTKKKRSVTESEEEEQSKSTASSSSATNKKARSNDDAIVVDDDAPLKSSQEAPSMTQTTTPSLTQHQQPDATMTTLDEVGVFFDDDESHDDHHFESSIDALSQHNISPDSKGNSSISKLPIDNGAPPARWGYTMTCLDDDKDHPKVLVYGGQTVTEDSEVVTHGDIHVYDVATESWSKPVHCEGVDRQWHSATFVPERQLLIAFGGEAPDKSSKKNTGKMSSMNQVMVLDTEIMLWYPPSVSGDIPSGRSGHTATMVSDNNQMVIFGGVGKSQKFQTALYVLDTTRWKWNRPTAKQIQGDAPRPRSYHSATAVSKGSGKDWIVYFGGNDHDTCFNTVHILEVKASSTTAVGEEDVWSWINPIVSGDVPSPRTGHAATVMEDGKTILVQGGWDPNTEEEDETIFDDCFLLDTSTWTWTKSDKAFGSVARVGHRAVQHKDNVYMFGGRLAGGKFSNELLTL